MLPDEFYLPASKRRQGEVVTFYSFKGGVGRTMALSNIAFLAAHSGLRVLVMDWDLEAPGLAYYFRGIVDSTTLSKAKESPGILNMLWDWVIRVQAANSKKDIEKVAEKFRESEIFEKYMTPLLDHRQMHNGGCLDHIGTGSSSNINSPDLTSYEDALARFPWNDFFTKLGGGFVVKSLRQWAKKEYDLVLIDSRTGLAEAAGICTMQLADRVAMCFVMNRQNIDGIARVASAIRQTRGNEVELFAVPMRVAREGTAEESEARARAAAELSKVGGFPLDELQHQLQVLAVKQAENVPFYEAISQVIAEDPELDSLTLNYARLAKELIGDPIPILPVNEDWLKVIQARLKPGFATKEFIEKLSNAEPFRGIEEFNRLLAGAQEHVSEGNEIDKEYVQTLVQASLAFSNGQYAFEAHAIRESCLDLLRMLFRKDFSWREMLVDAIDQHLAAGSSIFDDGATDETALLDELDGLLAVEASVEAQLRRVGLKRRSAQLYSQNGDYVLALHDNSIGVNKIVEIYSAPYLLSVEQANEVYALEIHLSLQRGVILEQVSAKEDALDAYWECLSLAAQNTELISQLNESTEVALAVADAHGRIALLESERNPLEDRCEHAVQSARIPNAVISNSKFFELIDILKRDPLGPERIFTFLELNLDSEQGFRPGSMVFQFSRSLRSVILFVKFINWFVREFGPNLALRPLNISLKLLDVLNMSLIQVTRRLPGSLPRLRQSSSPFGELMEEFSQLKEFVGLTNINWTAVQDVSALVQEANQRFSIKK